VGYHTITSSTGIGKIVLPGKMRRSPGHLDIVMDGVFITVYYLVRYHAAYHYSAFTGEFSAGMVFFSCVIASPSYPHNLHRIEPSLRVLVPYPLLQFGQIISFVITIDIIFIYIYRVWFVNCLATLLLSQSDLAQPYAP
jgi:hypothetical protein